uniref:Uncharacterized protein n=1 Tax=Kalanchoe fedtschenkoi TaxID=63787 RepID=A0A7N0TSX2_KALFE
MLVFMCVGVVFMRDGALEQVLVCTGCPPLSVGNSSILSLLIFFEYRCTQIFNNCGSVFS